MKNKDKYDLTDLHFIIIYPSYWKEYTIEVSSKKDNKLLDTFKTMDRPIDAIMKWLESDVRDV